MGMCGGDVGWGSDEEKPGKSGTGSQEVKIRGSHLVAVLHILRLQTFGTNVKDTVSDSYHGTGLQKKTNSVPHPHHKLPP